MKRFLALAIAALLTGNAATVAETAPDNEKVNYIPKITGMVNLRYAYDESKDDEHGFDVRRVRLGAKGDLHQKLDYVMQAEYAGNIRLLDAYLRWKVMPEFNVQVGQFKVHYSQETLLGPATWLTTEQAAGVSKLNGYNDLSKQDSYKNGRDIGLMIYGSAIHKEYFDVLRYRLGVFNGNGINLKDNNKKKDVAAMLWVSPVRHLSFTGAYYSGSYGPKGADHVRNRASAGILWKDKKLTVRSEYLWGHTSSLRSNGMYAHVAYWAHQMVQPVVQYDYMKYDKDRNVIKGSYEHNLQVGLNVEPISHIRIQAGYMHTIKNDKKHNNLTTLQCVLTY